MRLPIRARLTAWYALLLAAILVGLGAFLVLQIKADLWATIDSDVTSSSTQIGKAYARADRAEGREHFRDVSRTVLPSGVAFAQVLDTGGRVLMSYGDVSGSRLPESSRAYADRLAGGTRIFTLSLDGERERFRARVSPVERLGRPRVLVVAESLRGADESVRRVLVLLLLAGPAALAATALGGWLLARKALRPVERMISQAEEIGIDRLDDRIAVPPTDDEISCLAVTLNSMLDRLERGVEEKHRLVADASHELRTPLAVMRAELDVSLLADHLAPAARSVLESVREEVDRMSRTVNNLLTLAQVDEGRLELLKTSFCLHDALEDAARPLRPLARGREVQLDVEGDSYEVNADPERLNLALTNLIENAIKYSPLGGHVRLSAWGEEREVGVTVSDNGLGIPADARGQVFDRFYRADDARGREGGGSGLGLAICREIATAHGGRAWVDSEEGKGSAFSLALPRGR